MRVPSVKCFQSLFQCNIYSLFSFIFDLSIDCFFHLNIKKLWKSKNPFALCKGIRIPECKKFLLVESGILGFGIWNTAQGIRNPISIDKDWNPVIGIWNPRCGTQNPESKTVLDSLTWGKSFLQFLRLWQVCSTKILV